MPVNTPRVRIRKGPGRPSPETGYAYLDARHEGTAGVLAFAHRGGAEHPEITGLENTLHAFRHAHDLGYSYLETDVHVTRDGVLLAFHDSVLDRVTDARGAISDLTHGEVQRALIGGREQVPTLAEVFDAFPDAFFNIDLKSDEAVRALADFIEVREVHDRVLVGSFSRRRLASSGGSPGAGSRPPPLPWRWSRSGCCPAAGSPTWSPVARCGCSRCRTGAGRLTVVTPGLVRRAHAAGKHVHVWTIDDPDEMRTLIDRGVDGLMTDRTDILKAVLTEGGQWRGRP